MTRFGRLWQETFEGGLRDGSKESFKDGLQLIPFAVGISPEFNF